jgi:phosphoribosylanthranilate isomerase
VNGKDLKIKVCGMKHQQNVDEIVALGLDFIGNIFFAKSSRNLNSIIHTSATKVGVFVKESLVIIKERITEHNLKVIQLHGGESNEFCKSVKSLGVQVWKVFSVGDDFESSKLKEFPDEDLFLFDTKSKAYGGAGRKFDWSLLKAIDKKNTKEIFFSLNLLETLILLFTPLQLKWAFLSKNLL